MNFFLSLCPVMYIFIFCIKDRSEIRSQVVTQDRCYKTQNFNSVTLTTRFCVSGSDDPGWKQVRPGGGACGGQRVRHRPRPPVELLRLPGDLSQEQDQRERGDHTHTHTHTHTPLDMLLHVLI